MNDNARAIIEREKVEHTGVLNLNNCGLTEIPVKAFEMEWVEVVNLSNGRYWNNNDKVFRNMPAEAYGNQRNTFNLNTPIRIPDNVKVLSFGYSIIEILPNWKIDLNFIKALDLAMNKLHNLDFIKNSDSLLLLDLFNNQFQKISPILEKFQGLKKINLRHNDISEIEENVLPNNLEVLLLGQNKIKKVENLSQFFQLKSLDLSVNEINIIEGLDKLELLEDLSLAQNRISKIENLWSNKNLKALSLGSNPIHKIENISHLEKLSKLKIKNAKISVIEDVEDLKYLSHLDLSSNKIELIDILYKNHNLNYLNLSNNPISAHYGLVFKPFEDHWPTLRNYFERQNERDKVNIQLPVKVLLLGNHASGKSTLLHYLKTGKLDKEQESTHILNVDFYFIHQNNNESLLLPDAICYDFGGQDYYHGLYKTFLSKESVYLILWKNNTNENCFVVDSNGITCTHFNLQYWFGQKKFLETEKWEQSNLPNTTFLIQTHVEQDQKISTNIQSESNGIVDEYALSLEYDDGKTAPTNTLLKSKYTKIESFKNEFDLKIANLKIVRKEPEWYIEFLSFVFNGPHSYVPYTIDQIYPKYKRLTESTDEKRNFLLDDLEQLHHRGLILYYKEINPNLVWLSPSQFAEYVHTNLFGKEIIKNEYGKINEIKFKENLININEQESYIIEILKEQKVIFFDEIDRNYIVPGFLKLTVDDNYYERDSSGEKYLQFVLKFEKYLPFGFINQLICFYGDLPNRKYYWRDEMIFSINNVKAQIKLDFCKLEIMVNFIDSKGKNELDSIRNYLFYSIISLYWDHDTLDYANYLKYNCSEIIKEEVDIDDPLCNQLINYDNLCTNSHCRPTDLLVSLDGKHFINHVNFWEDCKQETVTCWIKDQEGNLSGQKTTETGPYRYLFKNKYNDFNMTKSKQKVFISYSKFDGEECKSRDNVNYLDEFKRHLSPLSIHNDLIENWDDTLLIAGEDWDERIVHELSTADIIFLLISSDFLSTRYIKDRELKIAFDREQKNECIVVPIIIKDCGWEDIPLLAKLSALPRKGYSISSWSKNGRYASKDEAWTAVYNGVKRLIEKLI